MWGRTDIKLIINNISSISKYKGIDDDDSDTIQVYMMQMQQVVMMMMITMDIITFNFTSEWVFNYSSGSGGVVRLRLREVLQSLQ